MSADLDNKPNQKEEFDNEENNEEVEDEVDLDLQNAMKNVKLEEGMFESQQKKPDSGKLTNVKAGDKKGKKNKGVDFLEYASKNGIQMNIEYEDKLYLKEERKNTSGNYQGGKGKPKGVNNHQNGEEGSKFSSKGGYNKKYQQKYNNDGANNSRTNNTKRNFYKSGNNKFDLCNMNMPRPMPFMQPLYNPFTFQGGMNPHQFYPNMIPNMNMGYLQNNQAPQFVNIPDLPDTSDKSILEFLEVYLSIDNLNKDLYLRNRINDFGYIEGSELVNHNKLKNKGVSLDRLKELLTENSNHPVIESFVTEEAVLVLRNRDWDNLKDKLLPVQYIQQQKKMMKTPQYMNPMNTLNYVSMQNNYFFNGFPHQENSGVNPLYMSYQYPMMNMGMNHENISTTKENGPENQDEEN